MTTLDVAVVGAGPVGLMAANLLAVAGHRVAVLEREPTLVDQPRAVSIDDEAMRTLQSVGLADQMSALVVPGTGTKYLSQSGRTLTYANPGRQPRGYPLKNPIHQPDLVRHLYDGLTQHDRVSVRLGHEVQGVRQDDELVHLDVAAAEGTEVITSRFAVGCDGGRSRVRDAIGVRLTGSTFEQRWLVIDTIGDPHDERYAMHHADPRRPHVVIAGREGRCRYEFMVLPEEDSDAMVGFEVARALLAPYRSIEPDEIVRSLVYTFHALLAERWRSGRVLLAGDAAHMMPPFAGQGLNTGLRDVTNLAWKLDLVLRGQAPPALLETYQQERAPHAQAMVDLSTRVGSVVMTTDRRRAAARDAVAWLANRVPPAARYLREMRFRPPPRLTDGLIVRDPALGRADPAGWMVDQPWVLAADGRRVRLDDVLGPGFALLAADVDGTSALDAIEDERWCHLSATPVRAVLGDRMARTGSGVAVADLDGSLAAVFAPAPAAVWLLRPDRHVLATFSPSDEALILDALSRWIPVLRR